jgi:hypothetical protein
LTKCEARLATASGSDMHSDECDRDVQEARQPQALSVDGLHCAIAEWACTFSRRDSSQLARFAVHLAPPERGRKEK